MLGFTVSLSGSEAYEIQSNRESGLGRFDIMLIPKEPSKLGIVIELKSSQKKDNLIEVTEMALEQINEKRYTEILKDKGVKKALKIGIGFCGKEFEMYFEKETL
jgi:hypothetical protein